MVGWHHWLNRHEFEQTPGDGEGEGSLACCSPWGHKESDTTGRLNNKREWCNWEGNARRNSPENRFLCSKCICRFLTYFTIKVLISESTQIWLITVSELRKLSFLMLPLKWEPWPTSFCQWHQSYEELPQIGLTLAHFFPDCCSQVIGPKAYYRSGPIFSYCYKIENFILLQ